MISVCVIRSSFSVWEDFVLCYLPFCLFFTLSASEGLWMLYNTQFCLLIICLIICNNFFLNKCQKWQIRSTIMHETVDVCVFHLWFEDLRWIKTLLFGKQTPVRVIFTKLKLIVQLMSCITFICVQTQHVELYYLFVDYGSLIVFFWNQVLHDKYK